MLPVQKILAGGAVGLTFGFALDRGLMDDPSVIRQQFSFDSFLMLRMFLTANAVSTMVVFGMHLLGVRSRSSPLVAVKNMKQFQQNLLGGALLGGGMYLSGSCPGTVWSQMGYDYNMNTMATLFGGIVGCGIFAYGMDTGSKLIPLQCRAATETITHTKKHSFITLAYLLAVVGVITAVEMYQPWREKAASFLVNENPDKTTELPLFDPMIAGAMIGLLQLPAYTMLGCGLGSSSGWMYLTNTIRKLLPVSSKTLESYAKNEIAQIQLVQAISIIFGSFLSQQMVPEGITRVSTIEQKEDIETYLRNFVGGIAMLLGARIAGGCTSGHGLTGIANLNVKSFITVAAMFGAGGSLALIYPTK